MSKYIKSLNAFIFNTKNGLSLRKIPMGCSKVKPCFQKLKRKRSLITGYPTQVWNPCPSDLLCSKFHFFYFLGVQRVKLLKIFIFRIKRGLAFRKIPIGCSKVKPCFQNDFRFLVFKSVNRLDKLGNTKT